MNSNNSHIDEDEIDLKEVFRTLFTYKYMIMGLVILFGLGSAYIAYFKTNVYKATSIVEVGFDMYGGRGPMMGDMMSMATSAGALTPDTEIEKIKSRTLAERIAKKIDFEHRYYTTRRFKEIELYKNTPFKVGMNKGYGISFDFYPLDSKTYRLVVAEQKDANDTLWHYDKTLPYNKEIVTEHFHLNIVPTKEFDDQQYRFVILDPANIGSMVQGGVSVEQPGMMSAILKVSYEDNIALRAKEAANALANAYIQQNIEYKTEEASLKLNFVDKQLDRITENLKASAVKLEEFKRSANTVDLSSKAEEIVRRMSQSETKREEISIQQGMLKILYDQVKSGKNLESISGMGLSQENGSLSTLIAELQKAIIKKRTLRENYTEMYPEVRKLTGSIKQHKKIIVSTIENLNRSINERKMLLDKAIEEQQKMLNTLPADERMFGQLQRKFVVNEKIYSYLLEQHSATAIIKASTVSKNKIIDTALLPGAPIKPKRMLIVLVGLILGLIVGIALAFLRAFMDDRIKGEEDLRDVGDIPIVGLIPHIDRDNDKIKVYLSPKSAATEAFRNLRTNMQFMSQYKTAHTIAVTSTVGGEGKTTVCINMGGIMSMAGKKTVIMNLDMRKPTLHEKFGLSNEQGMSTLLSGRTSLDKVIRETEHEHLHVITSGPIPPNPSELIQSEVMGQVLEELKKVYDVIILDTPPVGLVADAKTLMHHVDTSIYVLRANYSKKGFLRSIKEISSIKEVHGLCLLLNDIKQGEGYGYGYGYGYYEED